MTGETVQGCSRCTGSVLGHLVLVRLLYSVIVVAMIDKDIHIPDLTIINAIGTLGNLRSNL